LTACALFHCDVDVKKNLGLLRDVGLNIRDISGIACEDWDILKLAIAVKVICCSPRLNRKLYENSGGYKYAWLEETVTPWVLPHICTCISIA
jgi:hypothetical protein